MIKSARSKKLNIHDVIILVHILKKDMKLKIFELKSNEDLREKLLQGYQYLNRCKMLVVYPNEPSLVWEYIKA